PVTLLSKVSRQTTAGLLSFGGYLYVAGLSALLLDPTMKVLLSRYGSLEWVSEFEFASRIVTQLRSLFVHLLLPILPAASSLSRDTMSIRLLFSRVMQVLWATALPAFLFVASMATPLAVVWLGRSVGHIEHGMALLALGWLCNVMTLPAYLLVQGLGK